MAATLRDAATSGHRVPRSHPSRRSRSPSASLPRCGRRPSLWITMLAAEDLAAQRAVAAPTWRHDDRVLWDTTAECTLAELGLWNPTTGYGFEKPLALVHGFRLPNFEERPDPSPVAANSFRYSAVEATRLVRVAAKERGSVLLRSRPTPRPVRLCHRGGTVSFRRPVASRLRSGRPHPPVSLVLEAAR